MWQVDFAASPAVLDDLKHLLKVMAAACHVMCCSASPYHYFNALG